MAGDTDGVGLIRMFRAIFLFCFFMTKQLSALTGDTLKAISLEGSPRANSLHVMRSLPLGRGGLDDLDDYEPEMNQMIGGSSYYIPAMGLESQVYTLGDRRVGLGLNELEVALEAYPSLRKACLDGIWPSASTGNLERARSVALRVEGGEVLSESDIEKRMEVFRKVILGVEKYRISNPARIAEKYVEFLSACLCTPGAWGCAAYSLEYAGLVLKDHVVDVPQQSGAIVSEVNLSSLWQQAAVRLLDLEHARGVEGSTARSNNDDSVSQFQETSTDRAARLATADQKHFQQVPIGAEGEAAVRDMLLAIMRVALRVQLLGRDAAVTECVVKLESNQADLGGMQLLPSYASVKLILALDAEFALDKEEEEPFGIDQGGLMNNGEKEDDDDDDEFVGKWRRFVIRRPETRRD